jgi:replication initiation protein RepC
MTTIQNTTLSGSTQLGHPAGAREALPGKWEILKLIEAARVPLGLKRTGIALLRNMIALIQSDQISHTRPEHHICFASNRTLAERTHVCVTTVERHISTLVNLGLVRRYTTGNGKRWARRNGQGAVTIASGLSLLPLIERLDELERAGAAYAEMMQKTALLKDRCAIMLQQLKAALPNNQHVQDLYSRATTMFRRKLRLDPLQALFDEITRELNYQGISEDAADKLRDSDRQIAGHKETNIIPLVQEPQTTVDNISNDDMEHSFPTLCAELKFARTQRDAQSIMADLARGLGIGKEWVNICATSGPAISFVLLGYTLERLHQVANPRAYTLGMLNKINSGQIQPRALMRRAGG